MSTLYFNTVWRSVFPGSSRLGIELKTPGCVVQAQPNHQPCVLITAVPITKLFAWGGGGKVEDMCYESVCSTRDDSTS